MKYHLSFSEKFFKFRIDETGKTLPSLPIDADFERVGGSDSLPELKAFVALIQILYDTPTTTQKFYFQSVKSFWENRHRNLEVRAFDQGDF